MPDMNRPGRRCNSHNCRLYGHVGRYLNNVMPVACFAFLFRHGYAASSRTAHIHGTDKRAAKAAGVRGLEGRGSIDVAASRRAQDGNAAATTAGTSETPCQDLKFHPEEVSGTGCTNSLDYPQEWNDPAVFSYIFFDTAAACCDTYYTNSECIITYVCVATTIAKAPTVSLSPTPAPIESLEILELTTSPSSSLMPTLSDNDTGAATTNVTTVAVLLSPTPEFGEEAEGLSREKSELATTPSPSSSLMPTYSDTAAGTKNTIEIAALFAFVFPDAAWDDDRLSIMQIVVKQYFDDENDKLNVPFGIELSLGDCFGIRPATNPLNETQEGKQVDITFLLAVDADSLASSDIDEALFRDTIFNILQRSDVIIPQEISNAWEIKFGEKANGLSLEIFELTPTPSPAPKFMPADVSQMSSYGGDTTPFPSNASTTLDYHDEEEKEQKFRSWSFMTFFWLIVVTCFALENGLCACKCLCRKKQEFQSY